MSKKTLIYIGIAVFGGLGGYLGSKLDGNAFGIWGILGSTVGGLFGIWVAIKLSDTSV